MAVHPEELKIWMHPCLQVEDLKQQLVSTKNKRKSSRVGDKSPHRTGSIMSDYARPMMSPRRDGDEQTSGENSEEDQDGNSRKRSGFTYLFSSFICHDLNAPQDKNAYRIWHLKGSRAILSHT